MSVAKKRVGVKPNAGRSTIHPVAEDFFTPILKVRHSSLVTPFYYPNNPTGRYSIVLAFDREKPQEELFIQWIDEKRKEHKVPCSIYKDNTDLYLLKMQTPETLKIFSIRNNKIHNLDLKSEFELEDLVQVKFSLFKYYDKMKKTWKFNYKPKEVYFFENKEVDKEFFDVDYSSGGD
jgi:hypothetical protein